MQRKAEHKQKLREAMQAGQHILVDLDFDGEMTEEQVKHLPRGVFTLQYGEKFPVALQEKSSVKESKERDIDQVRRLVIQLFLVYIFGCIVRLPRKA